MRKHIRESKSAWRAIDLFSGPGGMSLGFSAGGYQVLQAIDFSAPAVETYNANVGPHAAVGDLANEPDLTSGADVIVGGPPCQGFSSAGLRRRGDHRNTLIARFAEIVVSYRPAAFLFENVEGFLTLDHGDYVLDLLGPLIEEGYRVHLRKINAANYGVPQHRKRVIAIGGLGWEPSFPEHTHSAFGAPGAVMLSSSAPRTPTVASALGGLPEAAESPRGEPDDHWSKPLASTDSERIRSLGPGQRMRDLPEGLQHPSYSRRALRRVMDGTPSERRGGAPSGVRRLIGGEPSKTITSGARTEFIHPSCNRFLTLRECARIQTFPDEFVFHGTATERAQQIGDAVPPRLAKVFAESLSRDLAERTVQVERSGALLSFIPTIANGMSPALVETVRKVGSAFRPVDAGLQETLWL
jgi:DNA (cytosine-5)-methyltransferase 1